jgi:NAD(P)-dependent dehydrogenase (short-subunit alcohol dehydrogenase family)
MSNTGQYDLTVTTVESPHTQPGRAMSHGHDLTSTTVLVTGASRGIGRSIAVGLAERGAVVAIAARSLDGTRQVADQIGAAGGRAVALQADVSQPDDVERMVAEANESLGGLDVLINNAGVARHASLVDMDVTEWDDVFATNLRSAFLCTKAASKVMIPAENGKIINVASTFGTRAVRGYAAYGSSKAALIYFTKVAALDLARHNIQVNAISPGYIATDLNDAALADPAVRAKVEARTPAGRIAGPDELVPLAALLASSDSDYMTGESIVIDGGFGVR